MARKQLGITPSNSVDAATVGSVTAAIASDATVVAAAVAAVDTVTDGLDLVLGSDARLPAAGEPDRLVVSDIYGGEAMSVSSSGDTLIGSTTFTTGSYDGLRVRDNDDKLAFEVKDDGSVFIAKLADGSFAPSKVHVIIGMGQSNMSGRGEPIDAELDPSNPRLWQFGSGANLITQATVPLDMVDVPAGLSPLTVIARDYLQRIPANDVVLLVPAAKGASILGGTTETNANGVWNAAYTGASTDLYSLAKTQIANALTDAAAKWPGATINLVGMFWHQGEANSNSTSTADYAARLDAIISDLRTALADADMPVVIGGLTPEYVTIASRSNTQAAHIDTPSRVLRTGFAPGVVNASIQDADQVHYHRDGVIELGHRMLAAYDRALLNKSTSEQHPPMSVTATIISGLLTVNWSLPPCRYTGFTVEYSTNGSTWTAITRSGVSTTSTASGISAPVQVRVATINENGTSYTTAPVYAISGG
jgi:hypothetical protein